MNSKIRAAGPMVALLALASAIGTGACSDDIEVKRPTVDAGSNADATPTVDAAAPSDAGPTDASIVWPDGAVRDAGSVDAAPADAGTADTGTPNLGMALWLGTDFASTEAVVVAPSGSGQSVAVAGRTVIASGDVVAATSHGRTFLLLRDTGVVKVLDPARPWIVQRDIALAPDAGAYRENPYDVAYVPSIARALVVRYADNGIAVIDPATGARETNIDLTPLAAAGDPDGLVDAVQLIADESAGKVYGLVQRIDQFDFSGKCSPAKPLVTAIGTTTRQLTGPAVGSQAAIELRGANPQQMVFDATGKKLYVVSVGCTEGDASTVYTRRGIEEVDLVTGSVRWVVQANGTDRLGSLLSYSGSSGYAREGSTWRAWSAALSTLGPTSFTGIAPLMVTAGTVLRLTATPVDGGTDWAMRISAPTTSVDLVVGASPWSNVRPDATYGVSGVFLPGASSAPSQAVRAPSFSPDAMRRRAPSAR